MRGRPRKDKRLPKYCYLSRGRYIHKPYLGNRQFGPETYLCDGNAPLSEVWKRYEEVTQECPGDSLEWLCKKYLDSDKFKGLAQRTQRDYLRYHETIMGRGKNRTIPYSAVTHGTIRQYLDKRDSEGSPVQGNREMAYLSAVYTWALQRDLLPRNHVNPCHGVERNKESSRTRYVYDAEYNKVLNAAKVWYLVPLMEMIYLCRFRPSEALNVTRFDILDEGLNTRRTKGSRDAITKWSPRLREAVDTCLALDRQVSIAHLFTNRNGSRVTLNAAEQALRKAIKAAGVERFTLHDLKAKGVSDFEGSKQDASGHKDARMVSIYDRKMKEVESTR